MCVHIYTLQLDEYETATYFIQLSLNLTSDCLLISFYSPVFTDFQKINTKPFYEHIMQRLVKTGKYTEIDKQSHVKFWLIIEENIDPRIFFSSKTVKLMQVALHIWWSFLPPL